MHPVHMDDGHVGAERQMGHIYSCLNQNPADLQAAMLLPEHVTQW